MTTVLFRLRPADPTVPWPPRGSGGRTLEERAGWTPAKIRTVSRGRATEVDAMVHGQLAVNVMLEGEGFAICLAETGWRISYDGAVFAQCHHAMAAAEAMLAACPDWRSVYVADFTDRHRQALSAIVSAATARGEILIDRVFPS